MFNEQNGKRVLKRTNKMINNWHECAGWPRWISFEFTCFINYYTIHLHIQYENYLFSRSGIITIHILTRCCTGISSALGTSLLDATRTDQHCSYAVTEFTPSVFMVWFVERLERKMYEKKLQDALHVHHTHSLLMNTSYGIYNLILLPWNSWL